MVLLGSEMKRLPALKIQKVLSDIQKNVSVAVMGKSGVHLGFLTPVAHTVAPSNNLLKQKFQNQIFITSPLPKGLSFYQKKLSM